MNSTEKGDKLADDFYEYLLEQRRRGEPLLDLHPPENCMIYKKKKYYCKERGGKIEFDIVIEISRTGREKPFLYIVFECKNYERSIPEDKVTDFSDKLSRVFRHAAKGVLVVSTRLQRGADNLARSRSLGIIKYDKFGIDTLADRVGRSCIERDFVKRQIFQNEKPAKSLKFSAFHDGKFFGTISPLLGSLEPELSDDTKVKDGGAQVSVPYLPTDQIEASAQAILERVGYESGRVDLEEICSMLSIELQISDQLIEDEDGAPILGSANFDRKSIQINTHGNSNRERFTLGHEIGHFCLNHDQYLRSETIVERDLLIDEIPLKTFNYERLEVQANIFASRILLPSSAFYAAVHSARERLDVKNRGHGYIFVDDQQCNLLSYNQFLSIMMMEFEVSKQVIEIRLKNLGLLTDQRRRGNASSAGDSLEDVIASLRSRSPRAAS